LSFEWFLYILLTLEGLLTFLVIGMKMMEWIRAIETIKREKGKTQDELEAE
jgi:hypothetical protein